MHAYNPKSMWLTVKLPSLTPVMQPLKKGCCTEYRRKTFGLENSQDTSKV